MRHRTKRAAIAALVLAIVGTAPAVAQSPVPSTTPTPTVTPTPTPEPKVSPPTYVLQAPSSVAGPELQQLAGILTSAGGATVVLRVPGSATIDASENDLRTLADAADETHFFVIQQGDARLDGAAAILSAFAEDGFRQPGSDVASGAAGDLWPTVVRLTNCSDPCSPSRMTSQALSLMGLAGESPAIEADLATSYQQLSGVLGEPAPDDGGGPGLGTLVIALLILTAGGLTAMALAAARRRGATTEPRTVATTPEPGVALPEPGEPDPGPPAPRAPAPTGRARVAKVVSVLDPEGYVELDRCLRRVRWASPGAPATPGERVDVEARGGRLWAYAAGRNDRARPRARAPQAKETQP
jgi:hypothetical protein